MLWTDGYFVTSADLLNIESEVTDVASANDIVINGATGLIEQVRQEAQGKILAEMQRFGGYLSSGLVSSNHLAAVFNVGGPGVNRTRISVGQVVIDPFVPVVKNWFAYLCLERFYRTAQARSEKDRYVTKRELYQEDIRQVYWPNLKNVGLPIVERPMPAPGALFERAVGTWGPANVATAAKSGATGGQFFVAITYVDIPDGYLNQNTKNNCESAPSIPQPVTPTADQVVQANLLNLIPPTGQANPANISQAIISPLQATHWNIYVGAVLGGPLYLQNATPIPIGNTSYTLAADPVLNGFAADTGQYPDYFFTMQDLLQRG